MIEAVKTFLVKIKDQGHVLPLIHRADIQVNLHCDQQTIQLIIKNGGIFLLQNPEEQQVKYEISGSPAAMKQLLEGTERLRFLEQQGQLKASTPLRTTLLLESIFFLTKAQNSQFTK
ncbi:SCP2 sterol-binding domain-containing protein [Neobacillus sp. WH10]|uniref:SCP2 sterol-binding domain-containing protein n=1 Tax=Neobacillus sp. WH10 TaxID=3047873 RepID=UPI0024C1ED75|nr:SCP2 sterol-binding domain-containing protein [Neobacillus sp. WH10]WHY76732.1 SCP2 sterol-binding domain-containing protein [Neobacillus sp. WH10]